MNKTARGQTMELTEIEKAQIADVPGSETRLSRRKMLNGAIALATTSVLQSGARSSWASAWSPSQLVPAGPVKEVGLELGALTGASVGPAFAGFSHEKASISGSMPPIMRSQATGLYKLLGPSILRLGGDSVDKTVWDANGSGGIPGRISPSDIDSIAEFVKAIGWKCLYGVNLGGVASGATSPALAASEVAYAVKAFGSSLYGIEIGNEVDSFGQGGHAFAGKEWNVEKFTEIWKVFRATILASSPNVLITGPAAAGHVSSWTIPFGKAVTRDRLGLITQHYYRANKRTMPKPQDLVAPDPKLVALLAELKTGADEIGVPYRMAEVNSYSAGGAPGTSNAYASALWVVDFLFNLAQGGASGADFHGGGEGPRYQAIANDKERITEVRPLFYGMYLFTQAGQGPLQEVRLSTGLLNITAYAVKTPTGTNLVIVNKEETNVRLTARVPDVRSASLVEMTQGGKTPNLAATNDVMIQHAEIQTDGRFKPKTAYEVAVRKSELACYVPALSAVLLRLK